MSTIDEHTRAQVGRGQRLGADAVAFIDGLCRWPGAGPVGGGFDEPVTPGAGRWPDDPDTVEEGNEELEVAGKTVGQVADYYAEVIGSGWRRSRR